MTFLATLYLFIGSYAAAQDEGIRVFSFDEEKGEAAFVCSASGISNPSFLCLSDDGTRVYAVGEDAGKSSTANFLTFDPQKPALTLNNSQATGGGAPCNIIFSPDRTSIYTANYMGGSVTRFPLKKSGQLQEGQLIQFEGHSIDKERQTQPHLHAVNFTPDGHYMLCNDLGTDQIHVFPIGADGAYSHHAFDIDITPGAGPRHLCFSNDGTKAYLLNEINGEVVVMDYLPQHVEADGVIDVEKAVFPIVQRVKADGFDAEGSADIHCSPDGKFLYTSHRLKGDGVSVFAIKADGRLMKIGYQPTGGHPRNFAITPNGKFLLVACRDTNEVEIYRRDALSGMLTDTGRRIAMPKPVCLQFHRNY